MSRVDRTDPSPYDQIFVLSEDVINKSFASMFPGTTPFTRNDKEAVRTRRTGQWITRGKVLAPRISVHVEERNPAYHALFKLRFESGSIHLRTTPRGVRDAYRNYPLDGWELVFKTRLASKVLSANDPKVAAYRSQQGFRDAVFELAQLYLDASPVGGGGFDASRSSFNGTVLPADTLENLKLFMSEWLISAEEQERNIIGYSLTKQKPTSPRHWIGTFAPSVIDYAPYAWIDPYRTSVPTDGLPKNALAVLTNVEENRRNAYASAGLSQSGAFISKDAAFCMNRDLFWNRYLLPTLKEFNKKIEYIPLRPTDRRRYYVDVKYRMGQNPKHKSANDRYFNWKQHTSGGHPSWTWQGDNQKVAMSWDGNRVRYGQQARSSTQVVFTSGGNDFHVKGKFTYSMDIVYFWSRAKISREVDWDLHFHLGAVRQGGLHVRVDKPAIHPRNFKVSASRWDNNNRMKRALRGVVNPMTKFLSNNVGSLTTRIRNQLTQLHKLFLPGGGVFRFDAPIFNKRGDLLADLTYLNVSPPTGRFLVTNRMIQKDNSEEAEVDDDEPPAEDELLLPYEEDLAVRFSRIAHITAEDGEDGEEDEEDEGSDVDYDEELDGSGSDSDDFEPIEVSETVFHFRELDALGLPQDGEGEDYDYDEEEDDDFWEDGDGPLNNTTIIDMGPINRTERWWTEPGDSEYEDDCDDDDDNQVVKPPKKKDPPKKDPKPTPPKKEDPPKEDCEPVPPKKEDPPKEDCKPTPPKKEDPPKKDPEPQPPKKEDPPKKDPEPQPPKKVDPPKKSPEPELPIDEDDLPPELGGGLDG
ncbi:hypothetical protein F5Y17DRAFT_459335 [Xylariaceae sp. FL0594]|nr:hypothetical protein F5Y17DRAFT_459335 [Xylariaceae sp. FL0594]